MLGKEKVCSSGRDVALRLEQQIEELPILPSAVADLLRLRPDSDTYFDDVTQIIEREPNYAVRLISAANSASSAPVESIARIRDAVARLGSRRVTELVTSVAVVKVFVPRDAWERSLWRHALHVATAARIFAALHPKLDIDPSEAYLCGLLHDIGRFVMFLEAPEILRCVDEGGWDSPSSLVELEKSICGLTHAELGALACEKWRLPSVVQTIALTHHDPQPARGKHKRMCELVQLCDFVMFPSAMPGTPGLSDLKESDLFKVVRPKLPVWFSITPKTLCKCMQQIATQADEAARAIGIGDE